MSGAAPDADTTATEGAKPARPGRLLMRRIRAYHAVLAVLTILAYATGEAGLIHSWLGYALAVVIGFRLLWAVFNPRHLGLMRFYPEFGGLGFDNAFTHPAISRTFLLGIGVTLILTTLSGVLMDRGRAIGLAGVPVVATAMADDDRREYHRNGDVDENEGEFWEEVHESVANLLIFFVILHVSYLILFKRPLARFMLFLDRGKP